MPTRHCAAASRQGAQLVTARRRNGKQEAALPPPPPALIQPPSPTLTPLFPSLLCASCGTGSACQMCKSRSRQVRGRRSHADRTPHQASTQFIICLHHIVQASPAQPSPAQPTTPRHPMPHQPTAHPTPPLSAASRRTLAPRGGAATLTPLESSGMWSRWAGGRHPSSSCLCCRAAALCSSLIVRPLRGRLI